MKRQILTGLAVAGALTLWVGSSAVANEDPAETLLQRAEAVGATASDTVSTCAEADVTAIATAACHDINSVAIVTPTTTPTDTENDNEKSDTGDSETSDKSSD